MNVVEKLPTMVRVGAFDFKIDRMSVHDGSSHGLYGQCNPQMLQIRIMSEFVSATQALDTFIHELMHAMFYVYGIADADNEERTVGHLSTALAALHRDNPWLTEWIKDCTGPSRGGRE